MSFMNAKTRTIKAFDRKLSFYHSALWQRKRKTCVEIELVIKEV